MLELSRKVLRRAWLLACLLFCHNKGPMQRASRVFGRGALQAGPTRRAARCAVGSWLLREWRMEHEAQPLATARQEAKGTPSNKRDLELT